jgi:hypothetical protein
VSESGRPTVSRTAATAPSSRISSGCASRSLSEAPRSSATRPTRAVSCRAEAPDALGLPPGADPRRIGGEAEPDPDQVAPVGDQVVALGDTSTTSPSPTSRR